MAPEDLYDRNIHWLVAWLKAQGVVDPARRLHPQDPAVPEVPLGEPLRPLDARQRAQIADWYRLLEPHVRRKLLFRGYPRWRIDDGVGDVFQRVVSRWASFQATKATPPVTEAEAMRRWVMGIAENVNLEFWGRFQNTRERPVAELPEQAGFRHTDEALRLRAQIALVWRIIESLPDAHRAAYLAFHVLGLGLKEYADLAGITERNARFFKDQAVLTVTEKLSRSAQGKEVLDERQTTR